MRDVLEVVALSLGFLGLVMAYICIQDSYWRESSDDGSVIITSKFYANLWMTCATDSTGACNCYEFQSMLALPGLIQACRALMITSIVLGIFGVSATLMGMQCSKVGGDNYILKGKISVVAGVLFILQGLCTMVAVSWYAYDITSEFFDPLFEGTKYEIGGSLYIGWVSSLLALSGGALLLLTLPVTAYEPSRPVVPSGEFTEL
uniref:Claudin n=1 Tax=Denticeps clupeoides TaxID=299321 RepID=A0AAY4EHF3_9TELE